MRVIAGILGIVYYTIHVLAIIIFIPLMFIHHLSVEDVVSLYTTAFYVSLSCYALLWYDALSNMAYRLWTNCRGGVTRGWDPERLQFYRITKDDQKIVADGTNTDTSAESTRTLVGMPVARLAIVMSVDMSVDALNVRSALMNLALLEYTPYHMEIVIVYTKSENSGGLVLELRRLQDTILTGHCKIVHLIESPGGTRGRNVAIALNMIRDGALDIDNEVKTVAAPPGIDAKDSLPTVYFGDFTQRPKDKVRVISLVDVDVSPEKHAAMVACDNIQYTDIDILHSRSIITNNQGWLGAHQAIEYDIAYTLPTYGGDLVRGDASLGGSNMWIRRSILDDFDLDPNAYLPDVDLCVKAVSLGFKSEMSTSCIAYERAPSSVWELAKQRTKWTQGWIQSLIGDMPWIICGARSRSNQRRRPCRGCGSRLDLVKLIIYREIIFYFAAQTIPIAIYSIVTGHYRLDPYVKIGSIITASIIPIQLIMSRWIDYLQPKGSTPVGFKRISMGYVIMYSVTAYLYAYFKFLLCLVAHYRAFIGCGPRCRTQRY